MLANSKYFSKEFDRFLLIINTFEKIVCLKSWGVIKEKEEEDDIREEVRDIENNNLFFIE